jgi:hypothetical protein
MGKTQINLKFYYRVHRSPPLVPVLSLLNPTQKIKVNNYDTSRPVAFYAFFNF